MTRDIGSIIMILIGGALLRITSDDVYLRYVKESLRPWLIASGLILIVLGVLQLVDVWRVARREHADTAALSQADAGAAPHGAPRAAWLLVLPILAIYLIAPPALGAFTAERQSSVTTAPAASAQAPPLPAGDPVVLALNDYASRAIWDDGKTLVGRNVSMTGFATAAPAGGWYLTRLTLTCCAADATVTKILVLGEDSSSSPQPVPVTNSWVTVIGRWLPGGGIQSETAIAHVQARTVTPVPTPSNPYE
jgi:uncharacterized repeat protein (TIGR03943 family)